MPRAYPGSNWKTSGQLNAGGTRVTITETFVTNNAEPQNDHIEVTATITAGPANRLFLRLAATQAP